MGFTYYNKEKEMKGRTALAGLVLAFLASGFLAAGCAAGPAGTSESSREALEGTSLQAESASQEPSLETETQTEAFDAAGTSPEGADGRTEAETEEEDAGWLDWESEDEEPEHVHTYGEWTVIEEATKWEAGSRERTCGDCGHVEARRIAAGHHEYEAEGGICKEEGCRDGDPDFFT